MKRLLFALPFVLGAIAVLWIALFFMGSNLIAFTATLIIALVYGVGFLELRRFRRSSDALHRQLPQLPSQRDALPGWLSGLPASLRSAVQRRIDGQPVALPGPAMTPYLSGLLVMLGLLGTFIGMIVTLRGAATALQGSTELHAIRGALAAPINGLSLAFGTSIAGVAASAMLGLSAALCRRERLQVSRALDQQLQATPGLSLDQQRQQAYQALHDQNRLFPALVETLQSLSGRLEQMGDQLSREQQQFQDRTGEHYRQLAESVGQSLQATLADSSQLAAQRIEPIMEASLARLNQQVEQTHQRLSAITEQQLGTLTERFDQTTRQAASDWQQGLDQQRQYSSDLLDKVDQALQTHQQQYRDNSDQLLQQWRDSQQQLSDAGESRLGAIAEQFQRSSDAALQHWQAGLQSQQQHQQQLVSEIGQTLQQHSNHFGEQARALLEGQQQGLDSLVGRSAEQLAQLRDQEAERGQQAAERLAALESTVSEHLTRLGTALEAPMLRLIETASQTPKAAAEVITRLNEEMARSSERDNELLEERQRLMAELDGLLGSQRELAAGQRDAIETLISQAGRTLTEVGETFSRQVNEQAEHLAQVAGDVTGSAADVASLGEAFGVAVQLFSDSNDKLLDNLQKVESALEKAATRSDEQLAYYVEQAREVIELSMASQKDVIEALSKRPVETTAGDDTRPGVN
ncbi:hypothetical protein A11A3_07228 [Alcanivorax hongdengensis A-11-3]|uniref:DUF802 domain-containing protein n=1 Tax=Alcanivorax hongdengensis A-11-3 TaxID=1177179 RepID=L0WCW5_9GAMM|nr:DUF802 domain-containing protein [Alcanivorax hongdengensis]EKF74796.1 hypothetical protein A11A3_07228 [Alcanivorax hongdengensis A-11-3]